MKAKHAIGFAGKAVKLVSNAAIGGGVFVDDDTRNERIEICRSGECDSLDEDKCSQCGCPIKSKTKYVISKCPEGLWPDKI